MAAHSLTILATIFLQLAPKGTQNIWLAHLIERGGKKKGRGEGRGASADRALSANLGLRACVMCVCVSVCVDNVLQLLVIQLKFVKIV